jgi:putative N-acetylmannosamine-6-phosphate epimerase
VKELGDIGPDMIRSAIDDLRASKDGQYLERSIRETKNKIMALKGELLDEEKVLARLETSRDQLVASQLGYITTRQKLVEKYLRDPEHFIGWLMGPANEHMVAEGKFNSPKEVAQFCQAEMAKHRGSRK